jgi:glucose dehydrogenase
LLRAYDRVTGEDIPGEVNLPGNQTGSPMTYMYNCKQYIVVPVTTDGANGGGELVAYAPGVRAAKESAAQAVPRSP